MNQDPVFFNFSLRANLRIVNTEVTDDQIMAVLSMVDLNHWFSGLSAGLDTELGNMGDKLSGGQRQRLAVARVLLKKDLKFLILDEATAALDYKTEKLIYKTIFETQNILKFTLVIIAHRLKSIKNADYI